MKWHLIRISDTADNRQWFAVDGDDVPEYLREVAHINAGWLDHDGYPVEPGRDNDALNSATTTRPLR
jgi:hypothetical protein